MLLHGPMVDLSHPLLIQYFTLKLLGATNLLNIVLLEGRTHSVNFLRPPRAHDGDRQMRSRGGSLGSAQQVLRRAISKNASVGQSYRGFMSDVKEELQVRLSEAFGSNKGGNRLLFFFTHFGGHSPSWILPRALTCSFVISAAVVFLH